MGTIVFVPPPQSGGAGGGPVTVAGTVAVSNQPSAVAVSNLPAVQPVSGSVTVSNHPSSINIGNLPGVQPVSGTVAVSNFPVSTAVSNFPATQPISGSVTIANFPATQPVSGTVAVSNHPSSVAIGNFRSATLMATATGNAGATVSALLPAVAGQFHYITHIEITMYSTAARTGGATPVVPTSINLPGNPSWTFPSAGAVGTVTTLQVTPTIPLRSAAANTITTIACPGTTSVIWRVNVSYYTAT